MSKQDDMRAYLPPFLTSLKEKLLKAEAPEFDKLKRIVIRTDGDLGAQPLGKILNVRGNQATLMRSDDCGSFPKCRTSANHIQGH